MIARAVRVGLLLAVVLVLLVAAWFHRAFRSPLDLGREQAIFEVDKGESVRSISLALGEEGLVRSPWVFRTAYRVLHHPRTLKAGEYRFATPVSMADILRDLVEGRVYLHSVTIPEGLTGAEVGLLLEEQGLLSREEFLAAFTDIDLIESWDREARDLEGYLFPETYHFSKKSEASEVVSRMVSQYKAVFEKDWRARARDLGLTLREATTLASLIEKETSADEEKALVSAVFHNRLRMGMKLDCDPTIIYALKVEGRFDGNLRRRDLKLDSPYNTYLHPGLPPGPICNPGRESLRAALYPSADTYIYFVSKNDGTHHFSNTFREHQNAVNLYQRRR